jgi:DNA repair exonuclease SbcCD ATPase subunit
LLTSDIRLLKGKTLTDHSKTVAGFEAKLRDHRLKQQAVLATIKKHNTTRILADNELAHVSETIDNIDKLGAKCPTCLQTVSRDHLKAEKIRLTNHLKALKTHQRAALADCDASQTELDQLDRDEAAMERNLKDFTRLQAEYAAVVIMLKQKCDQLADLETSLGRLFKDYDKLKSTREAVEFWVGGFKRIRLFIIDETLRQFELEVNNNLASLGLPDWRIEFDVERETKSGGVSKGFVVLVYPPEPSGGEPVRLEAWSGGETQRLRLAGDLGLANLIMDRAGLRNTIEIYDEPSSHLSQEGLLDLLDTLQQRAQDHNKIILIVDHHALDYGFDQTFTVSKNENTSHVE